MVAPRRARQSTRSRPRGCTSRPAAVDQADKRLLNADRNGIQSTSTRAPSLPGHDVQGRLLLPAAATCSAASLKHKLFRSGIGGPRTTGRSRVLEISKKLVVAKTGTSSRLAQPHWGGQVPWFFNMVATYTKRRRPRRRVVRGSFTRRRERQGARRRYSGATPRPTPRDGRGDDVLRFTHVHRPPPQPGSTTASLLHRLQVGMLPAHRFMVAPQECRPRPEGSKSC